MGRFLVFFLIFTIFVWAEDVDYKKLEKIKERMDQGQMTEADYELMVKYGLCKPLDENFYDDRDRGWFYGEECDHEKIERMLKEAKKTNKKEEKKKLDFTRADDESYLSTLSADEFRAMIMLRKWLQ